MASLFSKIYLPGLHSTCAFSVSTIKSGQSKVMGKILIGTTKKKRIYSEAPVSQTPTQYSRGAFEGKKSANSRRVLVLNKLFMQNITDLMANGELSNVFVGHGIEINRVRITPDFQIVNVYWLAKGTLRDDIIDDLLNKHAGRLRHELSQLRVMGVVPKIKFIKDKTFAQLMELDMRLANADFGDDYEPTELSSKLKSQLKLHTPLEPHIKEKIKQLDSQNPVDDLESDIPDMPQDVLGLNHADIMDKVKKSMKKSLVKHRLKPEDVENQSSEMMHSFNNQPLEFPNTKLQREAFKEFLMKRQLMKSKAKKELKNPRPELDYLEEEWELKSQSLPDFERIDDDDYIDDEESK